MMSNLIEHVVIIVKENHCFDNYFGAFPKANGAVLPHAPNPPHSDPDHRHAAWLTRKTTAAKLQFLESDIPAYFAYARQFTLCDNYFTDVAGPSTPNHLMLIAGDSPVINNPPGSPVFNLPSLPGQLDKAQITWSNYGGYVFSMLQDAMAKPALPSQQFALDAAAGKLPAVCWVYAPHESSEHAADPSDAAHPLVGNVTHGMQWTVDQVNAIVQGGLWPTTAIFITWDDWGGWLDHVNPPEVETWAADGTQFRYGSRVGCLVLSPFAKRGHISKILHSHVSLIRFVEDTFQLPPLNTRVAAAAGMADCFNFHQTPLKAPVAAASVTTEGTKSKPLKENLTEMHKEQHEILAAPADLIRIVPLYTTKELGHQAEGMAAPAPPKLTYRGGPLISAVEIFTVFWGTPWTKAPLTAIAKDLDKFFTFIVTSPLIDQLAEYNVPAFPIKHGSFKGTATITTPALGASVTDTAIQHMLKQEISTNAAFPQPNPNLLYFVYLPPSVVVVQGGSKSCQSFCGYHGDISGQIFYAAMPYANCNGCLGGLSAIDALTGTSSHEMCEAITDAIPGRGWYDDVHGEIGDICAWTFKKLGGYNVQLEWSNKANKCI